jgi:molybdenum cofactor cytidylyltransferase
MKTPKQLLRWGKGTLLEHAVETALKTACRPVVVVLGCEAEACRKSLGSHAIAVAVNDQWLLGLGTSVAAGIAALEALEPEISGALLMLVDQPMVTPEWLESMIARWSSSDFPIVATAYGKKGGVPALFDRAFFPELRRLDSDRGARDLIAREIDRTALIVPNGEQFDLDTPEEYRLASPQSSHSHFKGAS